MKPVTACPACSSTERQPLLRVATPYVLASAQPVYTFCHRCSLVHTQDVLDDRELNATYREAYDQVSWKAFLRDTTLRLTQRNRYRKLWLDRQLAALGKTFCAKRALEIGAKDGSFLWLLKQDGWNAVGIDPNQRYAQWARRRYGVEIRPGYFEPGSMHGDRFDLIAFFCLFEHIENPRAFLAAVREALADGGVLYLETDNLGYLQQRQLIPMHPVLYSRGTLVQTLEQHGFQMVALTEHSPGGLMTFDQLGVIAQPSPTSTDPWQPCEDAQTAKRMLERALSDDFPNPPLTAKNRLFRLACRCFGEPSATFLKRCYQRAQATLTRRRLCAVETRRHGHASAAPFSEPIRDAFLQGLLTEGHLDALSDLEDEFAQLNILARIRAYRLSVDATRRVVEQERPRVDDAQAQVLMR